MRDIWYVIKIAAFALIGLIAISYMIHPVSATSEYSGYYIGDHAITGYYDGTFYLDDNSTIVLDAANESLYLPRLTYNQSAGKMSEILQTDGNNYADALIVPAANTTFKSYDPDNATRIEQGGTVYLGETVDVAGNGWFTGSILYNGPYETGYTITDNSSVTRLKIDAWNLTHLYIDPAYYRNKLGYWYIDYDTVTPNGYDRLFYVQAYPSNETMMEKVTKKVALDQLEIKNAIIKNLTAMPYKSEGNFGYILSRNVSTPMAAPYDNSRYWVFASGLQDTTLYNHPLEYPGIIEFKDIETANLPEGVYHVTFIQPDALGTFEQTYDPELHTISSPFRNTPDTSIYGLDGYLVEGILDKQIKSSSQPAYTKWIVNLQDPMIDVQKLDSWTFGANNTLFTIAGYTNMNDGDTLHIQMDANLTGDKWYGARTWNAPVVYRGGMNYYRTWNATFAVDFSNLFPGQHFMTVTSDAGASVTVPFYVYRELPAHYQPMQYIEYIGNSPFIPPVYINTTVIKEVPGPTVYVPVTPAPEVVAAAQKKAVDEKFNSLLVTAAEVIVVLLGLFLVGRFIYRVYAKRKWYKE